MDEFLDTPIFLLYLHVPLWRPMDFFLGTTISNCYESVFRKTEISLAGKEYGKWASYLRVHSYLPFLVQVLFLGIALQIWHPLPETAWIPCSPPSLHRSSGETC